MDAEIGRDAELRIKGHLYEIASINDAELGGRQGYHMAEEGYHTTLRNVAECAGIAAVDSVAKFIKDSIRETGERPKNRRVRRKARSIVTDNGYPANQYLNSA